MYTNHKNNIMKAKTELVVARKMRNILKKVGLNNRVTDYARGMIEIKGLPEEEMKELDGLKQRYIELYGNVEEIINCFQHLAIHLSNRLGTPLNIYEEMLSESYVVMVNAIKRYKAMQYWDRPDIIEHFNIFMNHQIRTGLYMYFLKHKYKVSVPRRILLAATHFYRAKMVLGKYEMEDEVINTLNGNKPLEDLKLTDYEKDVIETCKGRLESISNYQLTGTAGKPEGVNRILESVMLAENIDFENVDWCNDLEYDQDMEKNASIGQLVKKIEEKFGEVALKYWLLKRIGFRLKDIEKTVPRGITLSGISYRIRRVQKWVEEVEEDYISGGVNDVDVQNYLETKAA